MSDEDTCTALTVAELIERLKRFPPDLEVIIHDSEQGWWEAVEVFQTELRYREGGSTEITVKPVVKIATFREEQ